MSGTFALSSRDRRTLVAGVIAVTTIVASRRLVPRWRDWDDRARSSAIERTGELSSLQARLARLPALRDSARLRAARAGAARDRLIEAPTVGAAGAGLATRVADLADDLGIRVNAVQVRPDTLFRAGFARVAVTLTATGDVAHLADLLAALESSDALVAVREITITPTDVLLPDGRPETLRFQLVVEALAVKGAARDREDRTDDAPARGRQG